MKIVNDVAALRLVDDSRPLGVFFLLWSGLVVAFLIHKITSHKMPGGDVIGLGLMGLLPLVCGLGFWGRTDFNFDKTGRVLTWRRSSLFKTRSGTVLFSAIKEVVVEVTSVSTQRGRSRPACRLVLRAMQGRLVISNDFSVGVKQRRYEEIAARIREILLAPPA